MQGVLVFLGFQISELSMGMLIILQSLLQFVELFKEHCQQNAVPKTKQKHLSSPPQMLQFQIALSPKIISHFTSMAFSGQLTC